MTRRLTQLFSAPANQTLPRNGVTFGVVQSVFEASNVSGDSGREHPPLDVIVDDITDVRKLAQIAQRFVKRHEHS